MRCRAMSSPCAPRGMIIRCWIALCLISALGLSTSWSTGKYAAAAYQPIRATARAVAVPGQTPLSHASMHLLSSATFEPVRGVLLRETAVSALPRCLRALFHTTLRTRAPPDLYGFTTAYTADVA
jgi:hypothetical protein